MCIPKLRSQMGAKKAVLIIRPKEHTRKDCTGITNNIYISVFALFLRRVGTEPHSFRSTRDNDGSNKSL